MPGEPLLRGGELRALPAESGGQSTTPDGGTDVPKYQESARKCAEVYATTWRRLQDRASGTGSTCDGARFVDGGDGTVTDKLTGLQWEKKTDDASVHDKDDRYPWSTAGAAADGTAFTSFLAALNAACFAGQCDWRLPTLAELQTILLAAVPAGRHRPVFGPLGDYYWSSTPETSMPALGWVLSFQDGSRTTGGEGRHLQRPGRPRRPLSHSARQQQLARFRRRGARRASPFEDRRARRSRRCETE